MTGTTGNEMRGGGGLTRGMKRIVGEREQAVQYLIHASFAHSRRALPVPDRAVTYNRKIPALKRLGTGLLRSVCSEL